MTVVRAGHPLLRGKPRLERFVSFAHLLVAPLGTPTGLVDDILARRQMKRRVARTLTSFVDAGLLAAETNYVLTLPRTVVAALRARFRLEVLRVPLVLPKFTISVIWHRRNDKHPEHAWMREAIARATRAAS